MERRDIEVFLTLAGELHFGRTAQRLRVSQARVSQTIQKIERQVGAPLFERTSRRVELTPIGRQLAVDLEPAERLIREGIARAVAAGRGIGGTLRIGFEAPPLADLIADALTTFRRRHPDCEIRILETAFADPFATLRADEADVVITMLPVSEPDVVLGPVVHTEPLLLAVGARHPFARKGSVSLEDLARDVVLHAAWAPEGKRDGPWRTPAGKPIDRGRPMATLQELLAAVAAGEGVCPLAAQAADYFARPTIAYLPIVDAPPVEWAPVWRRARETERIRAFAAVVGDKPTGDSGIREATV